MFLTDTATVSVQNPTGILGYFNNYINRPYDAITIKYCLKENSVCLVGLNISDGGINLEASR